MDETKIGREKKDDPAVVARQGFDALMKGDDHVVAGSFKNNVLAAVAQVMPDQMKAGQEAKNAKPDRLQEGNAEVRTGRSAPLQVAGCVVGLKGYGGPV